MSTMTSPWILHANISRALLCAALLVLCSSQRSIKFFHHGNELEQFEAYEKLTKDVVNETEFFQSATACEQSTVPENGFRSYMCRHKLREARQKVRWPLWQRHSDVENSRYKKDCKYKIVSLGLSLSESHLGAVEGGSLVFGIEQSHCHADLPSNGGSTFEIYLQSAVHLAVCNVQDLFSNSYKVHCPLPVTTGMGMGTGTGTGVGVVCSNVSVSLHYEHFDAFDDIGHSRFSSLHHTVYRGPVCAQGAETGTGTGEADTGAVGAGNTEVGTGARGAGRGGVVSTSDAVGSEPLWLIRPPRSTNSNPSLQGAILGDKVYEWRGQNPKYLTVSAMKRCLKRQTLWFIGESHMRYQFDITMDRYVDKLKMGRYHGSVNVSGVSYSDNTFSARLITFFDSLPCGETQQQQTLVLQTGSWDLQFFPPRAFIRNPSQGPGVVKAIARLKVRPHCAANYHIVWLSTMPHPYCLGSHEHCLRLMNYWRNNGAIRAANQYIEAALSEVQYPGLVLLDTPSLALPRFPLNDIVCVDHFLCNDQPRGFITTPTGIALSNEVLTFSCDQEMRQKGATFGDGGLYKLLNTTSPGLKSQFEFYSVEGGCRRQFPDTETLQLMGGGAADFQEVTSSFVVDVPVCFREFFLTRRNGTLYQTYSTKSVFYMDMGVKRQMNGVDSLVSLGREFSDVVWVLEKDFDRIPSGPTIHGTQDCNWCKLR